MGESNSGGGSGCSWPAGTRYGQDDLFARLEAPRTDQPRQLELGLAFLQRPNAKRVQLDLFYDYRTNVTLYPKWQAYLREHQPETIIFWGQDDIFFTPEGGEAYLKDLPNAQIYRLQAGHFAVEDHLDFISKHILEFYQKDVAKP